MLFVLFESLEQVGQHYHLGCESSLQVQNKCNTIHGSHVFFYFSGAAFETSQWPTYRNVLVLCPFRSHIDVCGFWPMFHPHIYNRQRTSYLGQTATCCKISFPGRRILRILSTPTTALNILANVLQGNQNDPSCQLYCSWNISLKKLSVDRFMCDMILNHF